MRTTYCAITKSFNDALILFPNLAHKPHLHPSQSPELLQSDHPESENKLPPTLSDKPSEPLPSPDPPPNAPAPIQQAKPPDGADKLKSFDDDVYGSNAALKPPKDSIEPKPPSKPPDDHRVSKLPTKPHDDLHVHEQMFISLIDDPFSFSFEFTCRGFHHDIPALGA